MKPRVFLPAVLSGLLLWAAFFPLDLGPLAFVALVPWLTLVRAPVSRRRRYLAAYLGGFVFFAAAYGDNTRPTRSSACGTSVASP